MNIYAFAEKKGWSLFNVDVNLVNISILAISSNLQLFCYANRELAEISLRQVMLSHE